MIIDELENCNRYPYGDAWQVAFDFLGTLSADSPEGRHALKGDSIYAVIECYDTKLRKTAQPEAHRKYVDIQVLLSGSECIDWWPLRGLTVSQPYAPERDISFFEQPSQPGISVALKPGRFAVFFPADAHMPGLQMHDTPAPVKKVVIKIDAALLSKGTD